MFVSFFHELKAAGVPVTLREYLTLMEAMEKDLAGRRIEDFYYLTRSALVKDERNLDRFDRVLLDEIADVAPSSFSVEGDQLVAKHLYIERRVVPLDLYLAGADEPRMREAIREYGNAIKDLAGADVFPGDLLLENCGVTRFGRVLFYDYDEVCYLRDCEFRAMPRGVGDHEEQARVVANEDAVHHRLHQPRHRPVHGGGESGEDRAAHEPALQRRQRNTGRFDAATHRVPSRWCSRGTLGRSAQVTS